MKMILCNSTASGGQVKNVFMKKQKKLLTMENTHDNINELRVKHVTAKSKEMQSTVRSEAAH